MCSSNMNSNIPRSTTIDSLSSIESSVCEIKKVTGKRPQRQWGYDIDDVSDYCAEDMIEEMDHRRRVQHKLSRSHALIKTSLQVISAVKKDEEDIRDVMSLFLADMPLPCDEASTQLLSSESSFNATGLDEFLSTCKGDGDKFWATIFDMEKNAD